MPNTITVISHDLEGSELKQAKRVNPNWIRTNGKDDGDILQMVNDSKDTVLFVSASVWNRIFGKVKNG